MESNDLTYSYLRNAYYYFKEDNDIVFLRGITKVSVGNKVAISIGEPGLPVRTNIRKI